MFANNKDEEIVEQIHNQYGKSAKVKKVISKFCKKSGNEEMTRHRLAQFLCHTKEFFGIRCSGDFLWIKGEPVTILNTQDIIWIYPYENVNVIYFIPIMQHAIIFVTKDKKSHVVYVKKKMADDMFRQLTRCIPWVYFGFREDIANLLKKNPQYMIDAVEKKRKEMLGI